MMRCVVLSFPPPDRYDTNLVLTLVLIISVCVSFLFHVFFQLCVSARGIVSYGRLCERHYDQKMPQQLASKSIPPWVIAVRESIFLAGVHGSWPVP